MIKSIVKSILVLFLIVIIFSTAFSEQKYWVPKDPPKSNYKIDVTIDVQNKIVEGKETVSFFNHSKKNISVIGIDWSLSDNVSIEVSQNGKSLNSFNPEKKPTISSPLFYELNELIKPGKKLELEVTFSSKTLIGKSVDEIKLINWYPRLWWEGIYTHNSFEVKLDVPPEYTYAISGKLNKNTGYYENQGVRTCGIYLGKNLKKEVRNVGDAQIVSLFREEGSKCANLCLVTAVDAVSFYKSWLGFYPFKFLNIIPGVDQPWGGYPFASGIVVIHGQQQFESKPLLHWKWITAHEIGHQYWGEYVMDDDVPDWLWIGMGIYADREYSLANNLGLEKHIGLMNRYLDGIRKHYDTTVDIPPAQFQKIEFDHNNVVIHGKGYSIISALDAVLGKELFQEIYKKCLQDFGGNRLGYNEFWQVCEAVSGENLDWFFDQWVKSNKYLSYFITSQKCVKEQNQFVSEIVVNRAGTMQMPIPVLAKFEDGSSQIKSINRHLKTNKLVFVSNSKLKEADLDPNHQFAMIKDTLYFSIGEITDLVSQLPYEGAGEQALEIYKKAAKLNLQDSRPWFKLGMTLFDGGFYQESFDAYKKFIELKPSELFMFTAYVWLGQLKDLQGEREEAISYYKEALKYETGKTMQHDQYGMKINKKYVEERLKTQFTWSK